MKIDYKILEIRRTKTVPVLRAKVLEKHTANFLDRIVGRRGKTLERDWIGYEVWHEAGQKDKVRAPKKLENLLIANNHIVEEIEEKIQCRLPSVAISFGRKFA